jgi:hypothetical protein
MSEPIASPTTGGDPPGGEGEMLQFDQAEFATPTAERPTCFVCHQPILEEYYEIGQKVMCPQCRLGVEASFRGGSRMARFLKATALGVVAAAVGATIYYAFVRATNINLGLIAIVLGVMVGTAVRKGTGNRGGRLYQLLAVFLTYSSIVAMNIPLLIEHLHDQAGAHPAIEKADRGKEALPLRPDGGGVGAPGNHAAPPRLDSLLLSMLVLLLTLIGIFYAIPIMEGTHSPISGLIYAFALWEAWKINKPVQLVFNGPFRLGTAGAADAGPEEVIDGS